MRSGVMYNVHWWEAPHPPPPNCCFNKRPEVCRVPLINWSKRTECCSCQLEKKNNVCFFSLRTGTEIWHWCNRLSDTWRQCGWGLLFHHQVGPLVCCLGFAGWHAEQLQSGAPVVTSRLLRQMCKWIHRDCFDPLISPLISSACWMSPLPFASLV